MSADHDDPAFRLASGAAGHGHDHTQDHGHGHAHDPRLIHPPGLSLLRMSVPARLAGAAVLSALLWLGVVWALR